MKYKEEPEIINYQLFDYADTEKRVEITIIDDMWKYICNEEEAYTLKGYIRRSETGLRFYTNKRAKRNYIHINNRWRSYGIDVIAVKEI